MFKRIALAAALLAGAAFAQAQQAVVVTPAAPAPATVVVPAGTPVVVQHQNAVAPAAPVVVHKHATPHKAKRHHHKRGAKAHHKHHRHHKHAAKRTAKPYNAQTAPGRTTP